MKLCDNNVIFDCTLDVIEAIGEKGDKGDKGDSAYQVAVENGFNGTVQEWLDSLKGEPGAPFKIYKVYSSIDAMNKDYYNAAVPIDGFVIINTPDQSDEDNGKLYEKTENGYTFIIDMSVAGQTQSIEIVQTTGNSEAAVMSQKAVTDSIPTKTSELENDINFVVNNGSNSTCLAIGDGSSANYIGGIAIGLNAKSINDNISIGQETTAQNNASIVAIGQGVNAIASAGVSIGRSSKIDVSGTYSVALGAYSKATESGVVSIGDGSTHDKYGTRRIVNVTDPINNQDAATKHYVDTQISQSGGGVEVLQETGDSETSVMSQKAVTDAIPTKTSELENDSGFLDSISKDDLKNDYFVDVQVPVSSYIDDIGRSSSFSNYSYIVSRDGWLVYFNSGINFSRSRFKNTTGNKVKMTFKTTYGYIIDGQDVYRFNAMTPTTFNHYTTTSAHNISSPTLYTCVNNIFFLSSISSSATESRVWKSTDSLNWSLINGIVDGFYDCKRYNSIYWGCGRGVYKSTDGTTWTKVISEDTLKTTSNTNGYATSILYVNNRYVISCYGDKFLVSDDGETWETIIPNGIRLGKYLIWDSTNHVFCSVKYSSSDYCVSEDLVNWTVLGNVLTNAPEALYLYQGKVYAGGGTASTISVHDTSLPFILPANNGGTGTNSISTLKKALDIPSVVQTTGTSEINVMSQKAVTDAIPTKTSDLENDSGFITEETDPTVPDWAKAPTKPAYAPHEVGAVSLTRKINGYRLNENIDLTAEDVGAVPTTAIVQTTGESETDVMSQKAVTDKFSELEATILTLQETIEALNNQ